MFPDVKIFKTLLKKIGKGFSDKSEWGWGSFTINGYSDEKQ